MEFKILNVIQKKTGDERLRMECLADTNMKHYLVYDDTYTEEGEVSNKDRHVFIFPNKGIKKGEIVNLYSRARADGKNYGVNTLEGVINHFFYFAFEKGYTVWNDTGDKVTLIKIADFVTKTV